MAQSIVGNNLESAKSAVLLAREAAVTAAVIGVVGLVLLSPRSFHDILTRAGIQSVKLPLVEIEASLDESEKQLAAAKSQVEAAQETARRAQDELAKAKAQLDDVIATSKLGTDSQAKLQALGDNLAASKAQVATSSKTLIRASGSLYETAARQRMLRTQVLRGAP